MKLDAESDLYSNILPSMRHYRSPVEMSVLLDEMENIMTFASLLTFHVYIPSLIFI